MAENFHFNKYVTDFTKCFHFIQKIKMVVSHYTCARKIRFVVGGCALVQLIIVVVVIIITLHLGRWCNRK